MMTITFDTLAFTEELIASGVPEQQAKAHAKVQAKALSSALDAKELTTKSDINLLKVDLQRDIAECKSDILKWVVGLLVAQTGLIIAAIKLMP